MGTNFYWKHPPKPACPTCGHEEGADDMHIGKSSMGWCFSLHVIPELGINTLDDWKSKWSKPGTWIEDEYGDVLTPEQMLTRITQREGRGDLSGFDFARNGAEPGPNGLLRHAAGYCVGHGEGTWDYISGEFF